MERPSTIVKCISEGEMFYFLELTQLATRWIGENTLKVLSEFPAVWVWNGDTFCRLTGNMM